MTVSGLESVLFNLSNAQSAYQDKIKVAVATVANDILNEAKSNVALKYTNLLKSGLAEPINNGFGGKITFSIVYAPFVEFGTGGEVVVPSGWEDFAMQFKGKGIRTVNLPARPYLLPAFEKGMRDFKQKLELISQTNIQL
jgi:hypothetical protein